MTEAAAGAGGARRWIPALGTVALLVWLAWRIDLAAAWDAARELAPLALAGLLALSCGFNLLLYTDRWRRALAAMGLAHPYRRLLRVHLGTGAMRLALPIHAGEFVNAAVLARLGPGRFPEHVGAIAYLKFLNAVATLALATLGWALATADAGELVARTALATAVLIVPALVPEIPAARSALGALATRLGARLGEALGDLLVVYRELDARDKLGLLAYSVGFQLSEVLVCHLLLGALGIDVPFRETLLVAPILMLVSSAPVTLAGIGVREAGAVTLLAAYASEAQLLAFGLAYSLIEYVAPLAIGLPWLPRTLADLTGPAPLPRGNAFPAERDESQ